MFDRLQQELDNHFKAEGITALDIMELPEPLRTAMNKLMRKGSMTVGELAAELNIKMVEARQLGQMLVEKGLLSLVERKADGEIVYRLHWGRTRGRSVPLDLGKAPAATPSTPTGTPVEHHEILMLKSSSEQLSADIHRLRVQHAQACRDFPQPVAESIGEAIAWLKAQGVRADGMRDLLGLRRHVSNSLPGAGVRDQNSLGRSSATGPCWLKRFSRNIVYQMSA